MFTIINYGLIIIIFVFVCLERYKLYHVRYGFKFSPAHVPLGGSHDFVKLFFFPCGLINLSYNMSQALRFSMYIYILYIYCSLFGIMVIYT